MKALVLKEYQRLTVEEIPVPVVQPDEVLVRVRACGICGSDVHGYDGSTGRRIPPVIMGHEAAGEIAETGSGVTGWGRGDRVTFDSTIYCGRCWHCLRNDVNLCDNRRVIGVSCGEYRRDGAFAEYIAVPARILYRLPQNLAFGEAALVEAVSVALHAVNRSPVSAASSAVVVGSGMIGLLIIQVLRAKGCARIVAIDVDESRLEAARRHGATEAFSSAAANLAASVRELTGGRGADIAFEAVGLAPTLGIAIECTRKGGSITLVGNVSPSVELPLQAIVTRELTLVGTCASSGEYPECLEMISRGAVDVASLVSAAAPLSEGAGWFRRLHAREKGLMKVLLVP
ncbi:MAG TPA: galactitol-1-phosphate 5-dehydrogenase [Opitutaceae bacterium]